MEYKREFPGFADDWLASIKNPGVGDIADTGDATYYYDGEKWKLLTVQWIVESEK